MIRIITDSTSDVPLERARRLGIDIVPQGVIFDGVEYTDGVDLKPAQFYEMLSRSKTLPTTTQANPEKFHKLFKQYIDAGDEVVGIFVSSRLSGTLASANIAKNMLKSDRIHLIDSKNVTLGQALLVYEAVKMREEGLSADILTAKLEMMKEHIKFFAALDTLKYLKMGGRLSSSEAMIGGILNIKPLIAIEGGEVKSIGKARGQSAAYTDILKRVRENPPLKDSTVIFGHSNAPGLANEFIGFVAKPMGITKYEVEEIGCAIGTHAGPNCVGIAYFV